MKKITLYHYGYQKVVAVLAILITCVILCIPSRVFSQETNVYSEGFEANNGSYTKIIEPADAQFPSLTGDGLWMWGTPSWVSAHTGSKCWGTNFSGNMPQSTSSILSPSIALTALTSNQSTRVSFWAATDISMTGASGRFYVSSDGSNFTKLASFFMTMAGGWQRYEFDISNYNGGNIYLKFFVVDAGGNRGFYVDDISISAFTKPAETKILTLEANESSSGSCPWIYTWDGSNYTANNDIYSTARYIDGEYRDYLTLSKPLVAENGKYKLQLNEVASDESFTDYIQLNIVDHAADVKVAPDNFGNIFAYTPANLISPVSAVSNLGINVLDSLSLEDSHGFNAYSQDYIDIDFGDADISAGARMIIKMKGFLDGTGIPKPFVGPPAVVVQSLINGVWTEVGRMRPRFDWDVCAFDVSTFSIDPATGVKFRLFSISHGLKYTNIDYVAIETGAEPAKTISVAPFSSANFGGKSVIDLLTVADNQYTNLLPGNHMDLEFLASPQSAAARSFIFTSEGYYIPRGSTYFIATWSGTAWIIHDSYSYASTDETKTFDLSIYLPDPANEMKVRIWQDYAEGASYPANIDFVKLQQGSTVGTLSTATDVVNNVSILSKVNASDNVYFALHDATYNRNRWTEYKWSGLAVNSVPVVSGLNVVTGSTINWTYTDPESDTQKQASVQVWTGPGGTGSLYWGPDTFTGTGTSVTYAGTPMIYGVTYYLRVKATDGNNWSQWVEASFLYNIQSPPGIYTTAITSITSTAATSGGEIFNNGGTAVTARGVCWSTSPLPTISNSRTTDGTGNGTFTSAITGLSGALGVTYYIRAYGTNSVGTGYGPQLSFTYNYPSVTTNAISEIAPTSATSGGYVLTDGNSTVTARGVCWNTTGTPTVGDSKTTNSTGAGGYTSSITGLTLGITYYVRAYATNEFGTIYGAERSFTASVNFCTPPASSNPCVYMWITNVTTTGGITNFSNATACGATSYTDYSATKSASQAPGSTVTMSFTTYGYAMGYSVWIDFNDNGIYASDEKVISLYNGSMSPSASFTVPASAPGGSHKMRVRAEYQAAPADPCSQMTYGETEEYTFSTGSVAPDNPTSISASVNPICNGTSTQLTANGAVGTVYWYTSSCGGTEVNTGNTITVSPSSTTTYYARNYNNSQYSSGCANITVTTYTALSAGISGGSSPLCYNTAPGTFTATGSGGTSSYTYLWYKNGTSTGVTTQTYVPGNLTSTSTFYCAITSESCGTVNTSTTTITMYSDLTSSISGGSSPLCYNTSPGTFTATGGGGTGTYTYLWYKNGTSTGVTTQTYSPGNMTATSTFYCAISSGSCGPVNTSTTTITVFGNLTAGITGGSSPLCYNTAPGTFTATGGGGAGTYTYLWYKNGSSTGITTQTYTPGNLNSTSIFYCAITSGSCGTVNTSATTITVYSDLSASISGGTSPLCYNTAPGILTATGGGGTGSYTYLWYKNGTSTGINTQTYAPGNLSSTSTFYCAVTSGSCGTLNTSTTSITVYSSLTAVISGGTSPLCYNTAPGTFTATGGGGTGFYTYLWYKNGTSTGVTTQTYAPGNLASTSTFYCSITSGSCGTVNTSNTTITVYGNLTASTSGGSSPICYNTAPGTFTASGVGGTGSYTYLWYKNGESTGIATQTYAPGSLTTTSEFYCALTSGSCGTVNTSITTITAYSDLTASINGGLSPLCYNTSPGTFSATGGGGTGSYTYLWYKNSVSTGVTTQTYTPGNLTATSTFYCAITSGSCGTVNTSTTTITVYGNLTASISGGSSPICYNSDPGLLTATANGGAGSYAYLWYKDGESTGITTEIYAPGNLTLTASFFCSITSGSCEPVNSSVTTITVYSDLTAGITGSSSPICYNTTPGTFIATGGGGTGSYTYLWYENDLSTGVTTPTYTPGNLTATSTFYCAITSESCGMVNTPTTTITVYPDFVKGTILTTGDMICYNTDPGAIGSSTAASGGDGTIMYQWQSSINKEFTSPVVIENSNLESYDPPAGLKVTTWYRRLAKDGSCSGFISSDGVWKVTVSDIFIAPVVGYDQTICWNTTAGKLNATASTGGSGSYSYQWQVSSNGNAWTNISGERTLSLLPGDLFATKFYRILSTDVGTLSCGSLLASNIIKVTVREPFTPSVLSVASNQNTICFNSAPGLLTATPTLGGSGPVYTYQWQYKTTGSWINVGTNSLTYQPGNLAANTQFRLIAFDNGTPACGSVYSLNTLSITVQSAPNPGSIGSDQTICFETTPSALTSIINGSTTTPGAKISYKWEYSINNGNSWTLIGSAIGAGYNPAILTHTTLYRRTTVSTLNGYSCESASVQVTITVEALPTASAGGNQTICSIGSATVSGALAANGTILWTENGAGSITSGETTLTPTYMASPEDEGKTVTLTMKVSSNNTCSPQSAVAEYTVNVDALPTALAGGSQTICSNGTAIVSEANSSNGTILWTENGAGSITSGETSLTPTYTASPDDAGKTVTLTMTVSSTNTCSQQSVFAEYTVNVDPLPTAVAGGNQTICSGGTATVNDAISSNGTILWTSDGAGSLTGETTITPTYITAEADAGKVVILTMTVTSDNNCLPEVATASYSINVKPGFVSPEVSSDQQICFSNSAEPLIATSANGGSGEFTYQWQFSNDGETNWMNIDNETTLTYSPGVLMETISYRILTTDTGTPSCADEVSSKIVTVLVNAPLYPPIVAAGSDQLTVCYNGIPELITAIDATGGTGPFSYQWQESANGISDWINVGPNSIGNTSYQAPATIENTYYRVIAKDVGMPSCGSTFSNAILIMVQSVPTAGSIASDQTICGGTVPVALTSVSDGTGSGTISYRWDYSTDGTNWSTSENADATFTPEALTQTTWFRRTTLSTLNEFVCESEFVTPVKIEVLLPAAVAGDDREICPGTSTLIGAEATAGSTYSWSSTSGIFTSVEANPTVEPTVTTTYIVEETFTATGCTNTNSVVVIVNPLPVPTITGSALIGSGVVSEYTTEHGFNGYAWTVSAGGMITSGEGTNSIMVNWIVPGNQTVSVKYMNESGCEPLLPTAFDVLVTPVPDAAVITQNGDTLISDALVGNQWYRDGVAIEGATGSSYTITEPGTYYVIVTINGSSSVPSNSVVYLNVSIRESGVNRSFDVYPNPSKGQFNIKVASSKPVELNIEIFNTIGVLIWKQDNVRINGTFVAPVNLNLVPNGAYMVTLRNKNVAMTRKVVILK